MESLHALWEAVLTSIKEQVTDVSYSVWIEKVSLIEITSTEAIVLAPNNFYRNTMTDHFTQIFDDTFRKVTGLPLITRFVTPNECQPQTSSDDEFYTYTFENFIVGRSNEFAHAAAIAVAQNPGGAYNPLFIYGESGLGKTHLLFAIANAAKKNNPALNVVYIKGDQFTNELIQAISDHEQAEFRSKYRFADILMVDDVQFIGGKESTQEEFFHTFNALFQERKQIILTSDRPPKEIATLEDRLRSRFEHGLMADVQPPEYETRFAIIKRKAAQMNLDLNDEICMFIANKLKSNIRQLEGVVKKINVVCMVEHEKPSLIIAQNAIKDVLSDKEPLPKTIDRIVIEVARSFNITPEDIRSDKRSAPIPLARQVAMYVVRAVTDMSYKAIGREFGNKDHTTVIYSVNQVESRMASQSDFRSTVEDLVKNLKSDAQ